MSFEFFTHIVLLRPFYPRSSNDYFGSYDQRNWNHLDQVNAPFILFNFHSLIFSFSAQILSLRGRKLKIRVYEGYSLLGRVHDSMYMGKAKPSHVYVALYTTMTKLARLQVREHIFERF